jgi:hypothetical protein
MGRRTFRGPAMQPGISNEAYGMLREQLKSKIHRACVTDGNVNYEGSIGIPLDLLEAVDIWPGEKVLVVSVTTGPG